jgi:cytochrome P450
MSETQSSILTTPPIAWDYQDIFRTSDSIDQFVLEYSPDLCQQYGEIVALTPEIYLMNDPQAFKHILKTQMALYSKNNPTYKRFKKVFGESLIVTEGPVWHQHKQLLQAAFTRPKLAEYASVMVSYTQDLIDIWKHKPNPAINLVAEIKHLTLCIAFQVFCNHTLSLEESFMLREAVSTALHNLSTNTLLTRWFPNTQNRQFFGSMRKIDNLIKNILKTRRMQPLSSSNLSDDLLSLLISDASLSDQAILDELKTMLLTGHETTACALAWSWHLLNKHPAYRLSMEKEIDTVLGTRIPTFEDCHALPMIKAIFLETLRLYPTIWCLFRTATIHDTINQYTIPANTQCILNIHALHRNPNYWENPNDFYPPRFLGETESTRHAYAYLPFSTGPHACIGMHFALTEGILLLATFAQHIRFKALYDTSAVEPTPYLALQPPALPMQVLSR